MKHDARNVEPVVVAVAFAFLLLVAGIVGYLHGSHLRRDERVTAERNALLSSLRHVYDKVVMTKTNVTEQESLKITPGDIRKALARGSNILGELPVGTTFDDVFIRKEAIPRASGEFVCVVLFAEKRSAYGLRSTGECTHVKMAELRKEDFIGLTDVP